MAQEPGAPAGAFAPMGIGDIISAAFKVYGEHWQRLLIIAAMIIVPVTIIVDLIVYLVILNSFSLAGVAIAGSLAGMLSWVLWALVQAAITRGAAMSIVGDPSADDAFQYGIRRIGSFLWISILVGVIVALPIIVAVLLFFVSVGLGAVLSIPAIIGAIFLATMLAIAIPCLVIENRRGTDALARSWELVKGHFWHVFGAIFVAGLIAGVVSAVIGAIFGSSFNFVARSIGDIISYVIVLPFTTLISVTLYVDLRARVENLTPDQLRQQLQSTGGH